MISVLILTRDEELNLPGRLDSVARADDVVVFDSRSTDRTVAIARSRGARVFERAFDAYGAQREVARTGLICGHPWVLAFDAGERPDEVLRGKIEAIARAPFGETGAYRMLRKDHFLGRWSKQVTLYPAWFVRL